jgi:hypothetical protein
VGLDCIETSDVKSMEHIGGAAGVWKSSGSAHWSV